MSETPLARRGPRIAGRLALVAALLAVLGIAAIAVVGYPKVGGGAKLRISGGNKEGRRHRLAQVLARESARQSLRLAVVPTEGSADALNRVEAGTLDLALVQGGLETSPRAHIREVAPLQIEPLHLLVKEEIAGEVREHLANLQGKAINIGVPGSGTRVLAGRVLDRLGIRYELREWDYARLKNTEDRAAMPDAVFLVSSLPSNVAQHLIGQRGYRLVSVPFYEALLIGLRESADDGEGGDRPSIFAYDATIPAFTYGDPPEPVRTIGTRLLLVARDTIDPETVARLVEATFSPPFNNAIYPALDRKLLAEPPELPWHEGTIRYLQRRPFSEEEAVELMNNQLSIAGALVGLAFFLWQWLKRRWRRVRERGFEHYLLRVAKVERQSLDLELASTLDLRELLRLREDLARLKDEAIEKFAAGELEGEELMTAFLGHVAGTRDHLTRMILHERENIENQAQAENRPAEQIWNDILKPPPRPGVPSRPRDDPALEGSPPG